MFTSHCTGHCDNAKPDVHGSVENPDRTEARLTDGRRGVAAAIAERDAPFSDYSQAPPDEQPDPSHVIEPQ
jgi:hypothetical protein